MEVDISRELATLIFSKHQPFELEHCLSCGDFQEKFTNYSIPPHDECCVDRGVIAFYWGYSIMCLYDTRPEHFSTEVVDYRHDEENPTRNRFDTFEECLPLLKDLTA